MRDKEIFHGWFIPFPSNDSRWVVGNDKSALGVEVIETLAEECITSLVGTARAPTLKLPRAFAGPEIGAQRVLVPKSCLQIEPIIGALVNLPQQLMYS